MDHANQRLETGYEPIHVDVWRPDLRLNGEAIYTKKFTDSHRKIDRVHDRAKNVHLLL